MQWSRYSWGGSAAVITSMSIVAGLNFAEHARAATLGGLLIIAIADNLTDSLSIHIYKETETAKASDVVATAVGNFFSRLVVTMTFVLLVVLLPSTAVVYCSTAWGLLLLAWLSVQVSRIKKSNCLREVAAHLAIALAVVAVARYLGYLISAYVR